MQELQVEQHAILNDVLTHRKEQETLQKALLLLWKVSTAHSVCRGRVESWRLDPRGRKARDFGRTQNSARLRDIIPSEAS